MAIPPDLLQAGRLLSRVRGKKSNSCPSGDTWVCNTLLLLLTTLLLHV